MSRALPLALLAVVLASVPASSLAPGWTAGFAGKLPEPNFAAGVAWDGEAATLFGGGEMGCYCERDLVARFDPDEPFGVATAARLPAARAWVQAAAVEGGAVVVARDHLWRFDATEGTFRTLAQGRFHGARLVAVGGGLLLLDAAHAGAVERLDPDTGARTVLGALPRGLHDFGAVAVADDAVYLVGGANPETRTEIWRLDPATGAVEDTGARLPLPRQNLGVVWTGEEVLLLGGWDGTRSWPERQHTADVLRFDPESRVVEATGATLPHAVADPGAVWTGEEALVLGGWCVCVPTHAPRVSGEPVLLANDLIAPTMQTDDVVRVARGLPPAEP